MRRREEDMRALEAKWRVLKWVLGPEGQKKGGLMVERVRDGRIELRVEEKP